MTIYLGQYQCPLSWTISVPGRQVMEEVTTLPELRDVLRVLDLPGTALFMQPDQLMPDRRTYTNDEGSMDEWSLSWIRVDEQAEVSD